MMRKILLAKNSENAFRVRKILAVLISKGSNVSGSRVLITFIATTCSMLVVLLGRVQLRKVELLQFVESTQKESYGRFVEGHRTKDDCPKRPKHTSKLSESRNDLQKHLVDQLKLARPFSPLLPFAYIMCEPWQKDFYNVIKTEIPLLVLNNSKRISRKKCDSLHSTYCGSKLSIEKHQSWGPEGCSGAFVARTGERTFQALGHTNVTAYQSDLVASISATFFDNLVEEKLFEKLGLLKGYLKNQKHIKRRLRFFLEQRGQPLVLDSAVHTDGPIGPYPAHMTITMQIYLAESDLEKHHYGTCFHTPGDRNNNVCTLKTGYQPNFGYFFRVGSGSWHSTSDVCLERCCTSTRSSIMVNWSFPRKKVVNY